MGRLSLSESVQALTIDNKSGELPLPHPTNWGVVLCSSTVSKNGNITEKTKASTPSSAPSSTYRSMDYTNLETSQRRLVYLLETLARMHEKPIMQFSILKKSQQNVF